MQHDFILLDRSASMSTLWSEALSAINGYVQKLASDNVDTGVTLATFDRADGQMKFDVIRDRIAPSTWAPVTDGDARPRGMTPLNDAIGRLVTLARAGINGTQYDKVAIIIMTDGHENASCELSRAAAKAMLDECRAKGWQVIFLGANFGNAAQASSLGNAVGQTISVNAAKMGFALRGTAQMRAAYGATGQAMSYTDEQKKHFT